MGEKIKHILFDNFAWKIGAIIFAIILWMYCMNITNPIESHWFKVDLQLENYDKLTELNLVLTNESTLRDIKVDIMVKGSRTDLDYLAKNQQLISARLDLGVSNIINSDRLPGETDAYYEVEILDNMGRYEIVHSVRIKVPVALDRIRTRPFAIKTNKIGNVMDGYIDLTPVLTPESISIRESETMLNRIKDVSVEIVLTDVNGDIVKTVTPVAYDFEGNPIDLDLSAYPIGVTVRVLKKEQRSIDRPVIVGEVAEGYAITSIDYEPKTVTVIGTEAELAKLGRLKIDALDVTGLEETKVFDTVDLTQYFKDSEGNDLEIDTEVGTEKKLSVTVNVEKIVSASFVVPVEQINVQGQSSRLYGRIIDENYEVTIRGLESLVKNISEIDFTGSISVYNLDVGTHDVNVLISMPSGIEFDPAAPLPSVKFEVFDPDNIPDDIINLPDEPDTADSTNP